MGLDITAYRRLRAVRPRANDDSDWDGDLVVLRANDAFFPLQAKDVDLGMLYEAEEDFGFRAGSYSGYNFWRAWLAGLADTAERFRELVNFSDCEGTIGPSVAAKLARDFAERDEAAKAQGDEYEYAKYREWRQAFEMAADGGAVCFH